MTDWLDEFVSEPLPDALTLASSPAIAVSPGAPADVLAPALFEAARRPAPLSAASIDAWWCQASPAARTALVLRLARALPHVQGRAATRLADPGWRYSAGLPLALATYAMTMRLRRKSRADNTLRAWRSDWRVWRTWCKASSLPSFNPSAAQLEAFCAWYAPTHKIATTRRLGATLTAMHVAAGFPDPLSQPMQAEIWSAALKPPADAAVQNDDGDVPKDRRAIPVDQAEGLRNELLVQILAKIDATTLIGARDAALIRTTYDLLGRRSEVVTLTVEDLKDDLGTRSATAKIRRSKTDQAGKGRTLYLRPDTIRRLRHWLDLAKIKQGKIFRALRGFAGKGKAVDLPALDAAELARILRRRVAAVLTNADGTPMEAVKLFSGHSCRVGAAQDMAEEGYTDLQIMLAGRWKSIEMVARYTEHIRAKQGAMAHMAAKQDASASRSDSATQVR
jgi:integrase